MKIATKRRSDEATEGATRQRSCLSLRRFVAPSLRRFSAFTLTEVLIVVGIIVLLVAVSFPAFNMITGSKSVEGATNQLAATLGRARMLAIGLQKPFGVMFVIDPRTQREAIAIVASTDAPLLITNPGTNVSVWLDLYDSELILLPAGISVQTMCDASFNVAGTARTTDGYLGYNVWANGTTSAARQLPSPFGGVILFDGSGQLTSKTYGFRIESGTPLALTGMGKLLGFTSATIPNPECDYVSGVSSQFGLVMFEKEPFQTQGFGFGFQDGYYQPPLTPIAAYTTGVSPRREIDKETWIDTNATPFLINRFNGTLVKGQ